MESCIPVFHKMMSYSLDGFCSVVFYVFCAVAGAGQEVPLSFVVLRFLSQVLF